jgi:hypothetical protein
MSMPLRRAGTSKGPNACQFGPPGVCRGGLLDSMTPPRLPTPRLASQINVHADRFRDFGFFRERLAEACRAGDVKHGQLCCGIGLGKWITSAICWLSGNNSLRPKAKHFAPELPANGTNPWKKHPGLQNK